jgi:hypothetical protein
MSDDDAIRYDEEEELRHSLIDIIEWYRDEWAPSRLGKEFYDSLIARVKASSSISELEQIEQMTDSWFN